MPDMRDIPFKAKSLAPSAGPHGTQQFRRQGQPGKSFAYAAGQIDAMSLRFTLLNRTAAEHAIDIMRENIIESITPPAGDFHGYSVGRLAATIGRWDETLFVGSESAEYDKEMAIKWAQSHGVAAKAVDTPEEYTIYEMGAMSSSRRIRASVWSAEVGTFTPYAGLVEDGGSMEIQAYNNPNATVMAHWEANHMFKKGMFKAYVEIEKDIKGQITDILKNRPVSDSRIKAVTHGS